MIFYPALRLFLAIRPTIKSSFPLKPWTTVCQLYMLIEILVIEGEEITFPLAARKGFLALLKQSRSPNTPFPTG
jgi:hypothetical protein